MNLDLVLQWIFKTGNLVLAISIVVLNLRLIPRVMRSRRRNEQIYQALFLLAGALQIYVQGTLSSRLIINGPTMMGTSIDDYSRAALCLTLVAILSETLGRGNGWKRIP